ncbi:MAG: hypothetical protein ACLRZ6_09635 [Lachnospiraceae bacterium]
MEERTITVGRWYGGDNAPACMVQGAVDAVNKNSNIKVLLTGRPDELNKALEG